MADQTPQHFDLPFRVVNGRVATVDQDSVTDRARRAELILRVPEGALDHLPDFGRPDWAFSLNGVSLDELRDVVARWDDDLAADATSDPVAAAVQRITVIARGA